MEKTRKVLFAAVLLPLLGLPVLASESTPAASKIPDIGPLPPVAANPDNPPTPERMALGRALFFDNRISATGTMNCATCHLPHTGWTTPTALSPSWARNTALSSSSSRMASCSPICPGGV